MARISAVQPRIDKEEITPQDSPILVWTGKSHCIQAAAAPTAAGAAEHCLPLIGDQSFLLLNHISGARWCLQGHPQTMESTIIQIAGIFQNVSPR